MHTTPDWTTCSTRHFFRLTFSWMHCYSLVAYESQECTPLRMVVFFYPIIFFCICTRILCNSGSETIIYISYHTILQDFVVFYSFDIDSSLRVYCSPEMCSIDGMQFRRSLMRELSCIDSILVHESMSGQQNQNIWVWLNGILAIWQYGNVEFGTTKKAKNILLLVKISWPSFVAVISAIFSSCV